MKKILAILLLGVSCTAVASSQTLRIYAQDNEPFFYRDAGAYAGLEFEILNFFAKAQDLDLEIHFADFGALLPAVVAGDADIAAAQFTVTEERERLVDFSASYFPVRIILVESKDRTTLRPSDLAGVTVATIAGSSYEEKLKTIPGIEFVYGETSEQTIAMVALGQAQATAVDTVLGLIYVPRHRDLHMTLPLSEVQHYGFAVPENSPLAGKLTEHLHALKTSGIYYRLLKKYFGQKAVDMVRAAD
ncbi:MAG: transporter substrate-binding domain-containing protein [Thermoanaerobaculia bacterium]|nr:transporter substrate-binding domain-containing protein [Thermoanaerobaculia bacterium]